MLEDFGKRSGVMDIVSFAEVFRICYRKGGNIQDVIQNTHAILTQKMEIKEDIETVVTSNRTELNLMVFMPIFLVGMIKMMSPDFAANFVTPSGIGATTIALVFFVVAYIIGQKILTIKF